MRAFRIVLLRLRSLVRGHRVEAELDDELRFHLERQIDAHVAAGLSPEAARTQALRDIGALERWKEECRDRRGLWRLGTIPRDLRYTWRSVRTRPGASLAVVLVLGLGLGLTSAMFALADPFILRPLPYPHPEELVVIGFERGLANALTRDTVLPSVERWHARTDLFQGLTTNRQISTRLRLPEGAAALTLLQVAPGSLDLLGVHGTGFGDWPVNPTGSETLVALTATGRAALPSAAVGSVFYRQDGSTVRIGAMLPATFRFPLGPNVVHGLVALDPAPPILEVRWAPNGRQLGSMSRTTLARLQPNVTAETVRGALATPLPPGRSLGVTVTPLAERLTSGLRPLAWGALAAGLLILGLCTAHVANLLLARGIFRTREFATREALGASRLDLAQLILVEIAVLAGMGVVAGLALAQVVLGSVALIIPDQYTALGMPTVGLRVVAFAALTGAMIVLVGLLPSILVWCLTVRTHFTQTAPSEGQSVRSLRFLMAAGQSAVAIILVIGAALLFRSFVNLTTQDTGLASDATVFSVSYAADLSGAEFRQTIEDTIDRLEQVPGVSMAGASQGSMVDGHTSGTLFNIHGQAAALDIRYVSPGYFNAVGATVKAGRPLTEGDRIAGAVVINEATAAEFWPGESALGQALTWGQRALTVAGIVANSLDKALDTPPDPTVFVLFDNPRGSSVIHYVVRGQARSPLEPLLRRQITDVSRDAVFVDVSTVGDRLVGSVKPRVFATLVLSLFAAAGLSVCAAGVGGIVSFLVARRTREIAIRTAIGAEPRHVRALVMRQALAASAVGLVVGVAVGRWLSRSLESLLYGVQAGDWWTIAAGTLLVLAIVIVATWLPATRALRISPTMALKIE
jgi:predicted permease